jgi:hypothetical protein
MILDRLIQQKQRWWAGIGIGLLGVLSWCPLAPIMGSWAGFFSAKAFLVPLAGAFGGIGGSLLITGLRLFVRSLWGVGLGFDAHLFAHILPGFGASLSWATRSVFMHLFLPVLCMFLFIVHPIGSQVGHYSIYWFIPGILWVVQKKMSNGVLQKKWAIFGQSLSSTFIAHAIGSVIWLYTMSTTVGLWQALIPLVAFERLVIALAMTASYVIVAHTVRTLNAVYVVCHVKNWLLSALGSPALRWKRD